MSSRRKPTYLAGLDGAIDEDQSFPGYAKLLWFDPGGTTGWSVMVVHPEALTDPTVRILENLEYHVTGEIPGAGMADESEQLAISRVMDLISGWAGSAIGTESFRLRQFTKDVELLTPVRLIGVMKYALWAGGWGYLHEQPPSLAMKTATDERLKDWGLYNRSSGGHARDADRHAITFLRRCKENPKLRQLAWPWIFQDEQQTG